MSERRQAVVLAGGKGTRLVERLNGRPKPLVDIDGTPLLKRQFEVLRANKVTDILILANHEIAQVEAFCRDPIFADLTVRIIDDGTPRGTAGALLHAFEFLAERFIVLYGDTLFDVDLDRFWQTHVTIGAKASLFVHPNDHPFDSDLVEVDDAQWIVAFHPPPHGKEEWLPNQVNAALYVIERDAIEFWRDHALPSDIARDLFRAMLLRGASMHAYVSFEYIKDIGTPKRFDKAVLDLRGGVVRRARRDQPQALVFIDRDGTINELRGDLIKAQDFELMEGVAQAIYNLNDAEYRVVVATNQPVLARGKTTFAEMRRIHAKLATQLGKVGAFVDAIEMCPHHPHGGFAGEVVKLKIACNCRKPGTLLVDRACDAFNADRSRSWFIGDTTSDMLCAAQAGLRSIVVATGEGGLDGKYAARPDYSAADLPSAVDYLLNGHARLRALVQPITRALSPGQLVLIGGLAKQGKSSLSSVLREALRAEGVAAEILSLDGYLYDHEERGPGVSGRYDLDDARAALAPWLEGRVSLDLTAPHYDRRTRTRARGTIGLKLPANGILIVEGVPALLLEPKTLRNVCRIFVDGDEAARAARVVNDLHLRSSTSEDSFKLYQERQNDEFPTIVNTKESANTILSLDRVFKS